MTEERFDQGRFSNALAQYTQRLEDSAVPDVNRRTEVQVVNTPTIRDWFMQADAFIKAGVRELSTPEGSTPVTFPDAIDTFVSDANGDLEGLKQLGYALKSGQLSPRMEGLYRRRFDEVQLKIGVDIKVIDALRMGYEYHPIPDSYFAGHILEEDANRDIQTNEGADLGLVYKGAIPAAILERFRVAASRNIFRDLVVISPDPSVFLLTKKYMQANRYIPPPVVVLPPRVDPFIIGVIQTYTEPYQLLQQNAQAPGGRLTINDQYGKFVATVANTPFSGLQVKGGIPFRIAHWDLGRDLSRMPVSTDPNPTQRKAWTPTR